MADPVLISLAFGSSRLSKTMPPPCRTPCTSGLASSRLCVGDADHHRAPAPNRSSCTCRSRGSTSGVFAGSVRSTAAASDTTRKAPPVPLVLSWQPEPAQVLMVDVPWIGSSRQEDRVDAALEVGERELLVAAARRGFSPPAGCRGGSMRLRRRRGVRRQRVESGEGRSTVSGRQHPVADPVGYGGVVGAADRQHGRRLRRRAARMRHRRRPAEQVVADAAAQVFEIIDSVTL